MAGSGNTASTRCPPPAWTALWPTRTATGCPTFRSTSTSSPRDGTTRTRLPCSTTACGGTVPFRSTTGTRKMRSSSINPLAALPAPTAPVPSSCAMRTPLATSAPTGLTMTRTGLSTRPIPTTTVMQTALPTTTTATATSTKTPQAGTPTVTACQTAGRPPTA